MKKLWEATKDVKNKSNLHQFEKFISKKYNLNFKHNYQKILDWSTKNSPIFWDEVWNFCKVNGIKSKNKIIKSKIFYKNKFLPNYKLNFTENLLVKDNKDKALTFISENEKKKKKTWSDLNNNVSKGEIESVLLIRLPKNKSITKHMDRGSYFLNHNRFHMPIITHEDVIFEISNEKKHLKTGEIWEINNNKKPHGVSNTSNIDRVHMLIDWKPL